MQHMSCTLRAMRRRNSEAAKAVLRRHTMSNVPAASVKSCLSVPETVLLMAREMVMAPKTPSEVIETVVVIQNATVAAETRLSEEAIPNGRGLSLVIKKHSRR